ncbi:DUF6544 family protein [Nostoc sp.]|uniref:DUF6544 family protein n=1 Tax=Nostoc sp. TaxID=1180 RepID=UPI002FFBC093
MQSSLRDALAFTPRSQSPPYEYIEGGDFRDTLSVSVVQANFTALGEPAELTLTVNNQGMLERMKIRRWGNPEGGDCHYVDFGGIIDESSTFDGYTIPTRLRVGWYFDSPERRDRFESEGEFFHCTIDKAIYK